MKTNTIKKLFIPDFILIEETIERFGYNPNDLYGTKSHKLMMVCTCFVCNNVYESQYSSCLRRFKNNKKCKYCSNKDNAVNSSEARSIIIKKKIEDGTYIPPMLGKKHSEETVKRHIERFKGKTFEELYGEEKAKKLKEELSIRNSGENNPFYGMTHSETSLKKMRQNNVTRRGKDSNFYGMNYNIKLTNKEFITKANIKHNYLYDYSITNYDGSSNKVDIICKKHGTFSQVANTHLSGCGCPKCNNSIGELIIEDYLLRNNINFIEQYKFDECFNRSKLPFDFYLPDFNTCIEYDGEFHYKDFGFNDLESQKNNDNIKNNFCKKNNIRLIRIPYTEKDNISEILYSNKLNNDEKNNTKSN